MNRYTNFYFDSFFFDIKSRKCIFKYNFDDQIFFEEEIFLDNTFQIRTDLDYEIINNFLFHLHIALGISYYKLYLSKNLVLKTGKLTQENIAFWKKFYINGLGEFLFKNNLDFFDKFNFISISDKQYLKKDFQIKEKSLVPVGGGKDSIVTIEKLKSYGFDFDLFTFSSNDNILYENTQKISQKNRLYIKRQISKNIMEYISSGAYNGHVPITGIIAFVVIFIGYIYNYKYILLSNEISANYGNTLWKDLQINHQYSKSAEFENDFRKYVKDNLSDNIEYFSFLRGYYELYIAREFARLGKKYFSYFSSCNTNFKIFNKNNTEQQKKYWCLECPKCVFVYIILRPFLTKEEVNEIWGKELYEDKNLEQTFRELSGISGIKPFECVGTVSEVILAMKKSIGLFEELPYFLNIFKKEIDFKFTLKDYENIENEVLKPHYNKTNIPKIFLDNLNKKIGENK